MPFWSRKKEPHPETVEALEKIKEELEKGAISVEGDTWRMMANEHVLNCILDDIEHDRISSEDASAFQKYNRMMEAHREQVVSSLEKTHEGINRGECSESIIINAPIEQVWKSYRDMEIISQTLPDGSADRIDDTHFWIKRVDPDKGDIWLETYEEVELNKPTHITNQKIKIEVQTMGMEHQLSEVNLEGKWLDYIDFEQISKDKTKLTLKATFVPSEPMTDYGTVFLAMFTQTEIHPTMKEEIQQQLKKFKEQMEL